MQTKDNLRELLRTAWRWRRPVLGVTAVAAVGSVVISLLLPVYYEATALFLAASPDQSKPEILYSQGNFEPEYYGNDADIDRLLTLSRSRQLLDHLLQRFDLMAHYAIDPAKPRARHRAREALLDLYEVTRTERDALELTVQDKDPQLAAEIANAAVAKLDELAQGLIKTRQERMLEAYRANVGNAEQQLKQLADTLTSLRSTYGIYSVGAQAESLTEQLARAEGQLARDRARLRAMRQQDGIPRDTLARTEVNVAGQARLVEDLQQRMERFNRGIAGFTELDVQFRELSLALGQDQERLQQLQSTYASAFPAVMVVEPASPPEIKARPRRMLLVAAATLLALLFSLAAALLLDGYRELDLTSREDDR